MTLSQETIIRKSSKGFTLIELLVVIAIIGLLSAVVLAALNGARFRGNDASVEQNLASVKQQAETNDYIDLGTCYSGSGTCSTGGGTGIGPSTCPTLTTTDPNTIFADQKIIDIISSAVGNTGNLSSCKTNNAQLTWAVAVQLSSDKSKAYCVDSAGHAQIETLTPATQGAMNTVIGGNGKSIAAVCQ